MIQPTSQPPAYAGSGNRAVAFVLDLLLLAFLASMLSGVAGPFEQYVNLGLLVLYFFGMPMTAIQGTLGKWICRIKICDRQGRRLRWRASLVRAIATIGWFSLPLFISKLSSINAEIGQSLTQAWWVLFILPWVSMGFMPRRESLFDLLAGTLVVRYQVSPESSASAEPPQIRRVLNGISMALGCLFVGYLLSTAIQMMHVRSLYGRIAYAVRETVPLRNNIEAFHDAEHRWPTALDLGIPEWNPYPDGGGYRLLANGNVVITFSVLPELKGRSITFIPQQAEDGPFIWQCSADAGLEGRYLPSSCQ